MLQKLALSCAMLLCMRASCLKPFCQQARAVKSLFQLAASLGCFQLSMFHVRKRESLVHDMRRRMKKVTMM